MALHPLAGKPATPDMLIHPARLELEYHERAPDLGDPNQLVLFDSHQTKKYLLRQIWNICGVAGPPK